MVSLHRTKHQYVYEILRDEIQRGLLLPSHRLGLSDLAKRFGVSEIPVREALKQLEKEDLVEIVPHVGSIVKTIDPDDVSWVAELRYVLEPQAAQQAAGRIPPDRMVWLEGIVEQMGQAVAQQDVNAYIDLNRDFHFGIYAHCPNKRLTRILSELWETAQRFRAIYQTPGHMSEGQVEHSSMLSALKDGDGERVAELMAKHRGRISNRLRKWADGRRP